MTYRHALGGLLEVEARRTWRLRNRPPEPGHPRISNNLLRRVRDYAQVKGDGTITNAIAEVDGHGLDEMDKRILETIIVKFGGGPVVNSIAAAVGEEADTWRRCTSPF